MNGKLWIAGWLCTVAAMGACQSAGDDPASDDEARLQALLHDEPLNQVPPGTAVSAIVSLPPPVDAGVGTVDAPPRSDGGTSSPTDAGTGSGGGSGNPPPPPPPLSGPTGAWSFDDCSAGRTELADSTGNAHTAFRSVGAACTTGINHTSAVRLAATEDIVYVPDQPDFTFESGVTVAGWFNPDAVSGNRTLFRKRDKDFSSFALMLNAGKFEFIVNLGGGRAISVQAPKKAKVGVFQHVAATYDGVTAKLYIDGAPVNSFEVPGSIPPGPGPLLMGNDGSERRFNGAIDSAVFATHALSDDEILQLTCVPALPTVVVSPTDLPATLPGNSTQVDLAFTNHSAAVCAPINIQVEAFSLDGLLTLDPGFPPLLTLASGETGHVTVTATVSDAASPGAFSEFEIISFEGTTGLNEFDLLTVPIDEPTGCHVDTLHELMIKSTSVVDDVLRTGPPGADPRMGVWTFQHLAETMAATPADAPAMVEGVLDSMAGDETINGFQVAGRPGMKDVIKNWPRTADGKLDLSRAPMMLQAIVNRFDLRNLANGDAGEGRFVFAFMQPDLQNPFQATMIFEYKLPAATDADVRGWAAAFHQLGSLPFGEDYNAALQAITERFAGRGARPGHPNGSAINTVRTNEIAFGGIWEMRQFQLSATTGRLEPHVVDLTPDLHFNDSSTVADYIDQNQAAIIAETHAVPDSFEGQPFAAGTVFNDLSSWFAPGVDPEARFHFSVNTCNGCHSLQETQTGFLQISPRVAHSEATLSAFLQGTTVSDPVTGQPRTLNDLGRRNTDLKAIVCDDPTAKALAGTTLRKGIQRVH